MRRFLFLILLLFCNPSLAQNQADEFYDAEEMQQARDSMKQMGGGQLNYLVFVEQFEYHQHEQEESLVLDSQAWLGGDINKLWFKIEGAYDLDNNQAGDLELQALYSRAISPFWNIQIGARHDFKSTLKPSSAYGVIGLQGLAPYWFEVDADMFVSERGKFSSRVAADYEFHLTQRLILQSKVELNAAFSEAREINSGEGLNNALLGLRLRYEYKREIAPYVGISWERAYGETKNLLRLAGEDDEHFAFVVGVRLWY